MISIKGISKRFGNFTAVDHLNFEIAPGEVLGFLGPNGAGKSTTMKMLTGFLTPDSGSISLDGYDIAKNARTVKANIGYLPEGAPSYGEMSVGGFLAFIAAIRGYSGTEKNRRIKRVVGLLDLKGVLEQSIDTLSKGYKRRVGLAQAILHDPQVLILDEPTDGLDPNQKLQVRDLIRNLAADKIVIISTHILEEVEALCSRVIIIHEGSIVVDGTPAQLKSQSRYHQAVTLRLSTEVDAQSALAELPEVDAIEKDEAGSLTIFPRQGCEIYSSIQALIQARQWPVAEIQLDSGRLDDVFYQVTGGARA